jgi:hypothetical protein
VAQLGARLDGIEEVVGSNPIGSTKGIILLMLRSCEFAGFSSTGRQNISIVSGELFLVTDYISYT